MSTTQIIKTIASCAAVASAIKMEPARSLDLSAGDAEQPAQPFNLITWNAWQANSHYQQFLLEHFEDSSMIAIQEGSRGPRGDANHPTDNPSRALASKKDSQMPNEFLSVRTIAELKGWKVATAGNAEKYGLMTLYDPKRFTTEDLPECQYYDTVGRSGLACTFQDLAAPYGIFTVFNMHIGHDDEWSKKHGEEFEGTGVDGHAYKAMAEEVQQKLEEYHTSNNLQTVVDFTIFTGDTNELGQFFGKKVGKGEKEAKVPVPTSGQFHSKPNTIISHTAPQIAAGDQIIVSSSRDWVTTSDIVALDAFGTDRVLPTYNHIGDAWESEKPANSNWKKGFPWRSDDQRIWEHVGDKYESDHLPLKIQITNYPTSFASQINATNA